MAWTGLKSTEDRNGAQMCRQRHFLHDIRNLCPQYTASCANTRARRGLQLLTVTVDVPVGFPFPFQGRHGIRYNPLLVHDLQFQCSLRRAWPNLCPTCVLTSAGPVLQSLVMQGTFDLFDLL